MYYFEEMDLRREMDRIQLRLNDALDDVHELNEQNEALVDAIWEMYAAFHNLLPHLAEQVVNENETLRRLLT